MIVLLKQAGWVEVRSWIKSVIGLTGAADQALPNPSRNLDDLILRKAGSDPLGNPLTPLA